METKTKRTSEINWRLGLLLGAVCFAIGALSNEHKFDVTLQTIFFVFVGAIILPPLLKQAANYISSQQQSTANSLTKENQALKEAIESLEKENASLKEKLLLADHYVEEKRLGKVPKKNYVLIHLLVSLLRKNHGNVKYEPLCNAFGQLFDEYYSKNSSKRNHGYGQKSLTILFRKAKQEASNEDFGLGSEEAFVEWAIEHFEEKLRIAKP